MMSSLPATPGNLLEKRHFFNGCPIAMTSPRARGFPRTDSTIAQLVICIVLFAALAILRATFAATIDLRVDEAYYWTWSREGAMSYLDHPPLVAWAIRFGTLLFGDSNFGVRFAGLVSMLVMQLLLADIVWRVVRDIRYVLVVALLPEACLTFGLGMAKITPDVALIPFELAMMWSLVRLWQSDDQRWWLAAGLFGGLALASKYTALLLLPAIALFVLVPDWRVRHLRSPWLWLGAVLALLIFSPVLYWNAIHDWASFRFQLDRPAQLSGWSLKFFGDFLGQQFVLIGVLMLPVIMWGTAMLAMRGFRHRDPVAILLSSAVMFPLLFLVWHSLTARVGDSWPLFIWPLAFACTAIGYKHWREHSSSWPARMSLATLGVAVVGGIAFVAATELYYLTGKANVLGKDDPIGKEISFADVVAAADVARRDAGAKWFVTTDYRMWSMLRWHLRDAVPVIQLNERARYIGFRHPALDGDVALYVAPKGNRNLVLWNRTNATRQTVGKVDLAWRGVTYDVYIMQKVTGFKPVLSPPPGDPLYVAAPN
jgi:4-amino-4-deoxy-L-arabinose transferase-like glycosyltransferase